MKSVLLRSALVAALGGLLFGFDTAVISGAEGMLKALFAETDVQGGALSNRESNPELVNCILWNNSAPEYQEIFNQESTLKVTFSLVKGGYTGIGNIDSESLFADKWLRLSANSPCIDAGNNQAVSKAFNHDLDANPRIKNGTLDMGAYEFFSSNIENGIK